MEEKTEFVSKRTELMKKRKINGQHHEAHGVGSDDHILVLTSSSSVI